MGYLAVIVIIAVLGYLLRRHLRQSRNHHVDYDGERPRNPRAEGGPRNPLP